MGEKVAAEYLRRRGFSIRDRNFVRKTGELDIIAEKENTLHFVEVKTILTNEFLDDKNTRDDYDPSLNLHEAKIRKVARTGSGMSLRKNGRGSGRWTERSCGYAAETAWRALATCHKSSDDDMVGRTGCRIPVVRLLWEQDDGVRFSAPRQII